MARAEIHPGACGLSTTVEATKNGKGVNLQIESECKAIRRMAEELPHVDPFKEISARRSMPQTLEMGHKYCSHAACPVPVGIIKAVEVASGLALPRDVSIHITK